MSPAAPSPPASPAPLHHSLVDRVRGILVDPRAEWPVIADEPATAGSIYLRYVAPLAAIPAVCSAIGNLGIGAGLPVVGAVRFSPMWAVRSAAILYVELSLALYLIALIIATVAPLFGGQRDLIQALKASAYSATPVFIVGIFAVIPGLWIAKLVLLIGLFFSIYLLYLGLPAVMRTPRSNAWAYTTTTVVAVVCLFSAIVVVASQLSTLVRERAAS
jgi:hypothetical protein